MALPSSGALSMYDIQTEFGGSSPINMSEYYGADSGVPSSGTISISDFYGTSAYTPPTRSYNGYSAIGNGTSFSSSFNLGTESSTRRVVVALTGRGSQGVSATSVKVGGVALTRAVGRLVDDPYGRTIAEIWIGAVPTGTTATVAITFGKNLALGGFGVWSTYNVLSNSPVASKAVSEGDVSMSLQANDLVFGCGCGDGSSTSYSGITRRWNINQSSGGDSVATSTGTKSMSITVGPWPAVCACAFR